MSEYLTEIEKVLGKKYFKELFEDWKKDMNTIGPKWFQTMVKQGLKPIPQIEERIDRMEQDNRARNKDIETISLTLEKLQEDFANLSKKTTELPKTVEQVVKEDNKDLAKSIAKDFEAISERKPKSLWKFWKRK